MTKRTKEERETNMANSLRGFDLKIKKKKKTRNEHEKEVGEQIGGSRCGINVDC